jgi:hypothetical protein
MNLNYIEIPFVSTLSLGCKRHQLMPYREIMFVPSEIHIKHINALRGSKVEVLIVVYKVTSSRCPRNRIRDRRRVWKLDFKPKVTKQTAGTEENIFF